MSENKKQQLVPRLRFPEFREAAEWACAPLGRLFSERQEVGFTNLPLLSLMDKEGIIPQEDTNRKNNSSADKSKYLRVVPGDIAYNTMRMWEGRSAYAGLEGLISPAYTVCVPGDGVNGIYFSYQFKTTSLIREFRRYSQGLVKDTLNLKFETFSRIEIPYPADAQEQQKIADCLTSLDELIAAESQKLDALKTHKKGLMQQLFPREGETVPRLRFPEFREAGEWAEKPLGVICDVLNNRRQPISSDQRKSGPYPYYGASGIVDFVDNYLFDERLVLIGEDGAKWGAFEKTAFIAEGKYWVNNHAHVLKPVEVNDVLFENYLVMLDLAPYVAGAAPPKLTLAKLKGIPVRFPAAQPEQQKIADCLSSLDELITAQTKKIAALKTHKKGLMQQLFPVLEDVPA